MTRDIAWPRIPSSLAAVSEIGELEQSGDELSVFELRAV
jgi:hypothetical protein